MTLKPLVVIDIVGLTPSLLGPSTPRLNALIADGYLAKLEGVFPAVTCTAQSSMLTGVLPTKHGIVGNGWYFRDLAEVWFWRQANQLVQGEKVWEAARAALPGFACAQLFWWYNMYAATDWSITPRPIYPADGRKIPGLYSQPSALAQTAEVRRGPFPFFNFWGPRADVKSSAWIAQCAADVFDAHRPSLSLVYLPHLDYDGQRLGPRDPRFMKAVAEVDAVAGTLIEHVRAGGGEVLIVSEYGLEQATGHVDINRELRRAGYLEVRDTLGWELLDFGASRAFAVADHQVAHVYVRDPADLAAVASLLERIPGIERVLQGGELAEWGIAHPRSGELVALAEAGFWFTYYYWLDDDKAPDFAPTVDIHRKPGYDPAELFIDPDIAFPRLRVATRLLQKKLGFRMLMDVVPTKPQLVRGTHGRLASDPENGPLLIGSDRRFARDACRMTDVKGLILRHWK
jgi:predicted AlkP superfamily pyrophosphatase or phosphodiesterase